MFFCISFNSKESVKSNDSLKDNNNSIVVEDSSISFYDYKMSFHDMENISIKKIEPTIDGGYIAIGSNVEFINVIIKYDKDGNIEWQKNADVFTVSTLFRDVIVGKDGEYIVVGCSNSDEGENAIILKYDKNGNKIWEQIYGGTGRDDFNAVIGASDGSYIAIGNSNSLDIEGLVGKGYGDGIIVKYDKYGNIEWRKVQNCVYGSVTLTNDGDYLVAGYTSFEYDIYGTDALIVRYSVDGDILWQKSICGNFDEQFYAIRRLIDDTYILSFYSNSEYIEGIKNNYVDELVFVKLIGTE